MHDLAFLAKNKHHIAADDGAARPTRLVNVPLSSNTGPG